MGNKTLLIGVRHKPSNLDVVVSFLEKQELSNKKVMIETPCYPLPPEYYERSISFCIFFDGLYEYLKKNKAVIIHGGNKKLIEESQRKLEKLWSETPWKYGLFSEEWNKEYDKIVCQKIDPHFFKVYELHQPGIIIIGLKHTDYFLKKEYFPYHEIK